MRRPRLIALLVAFSALLSVAVGVVVNVATDGGIAFLEPLGSWIWLVVGILAALTAAAALLLHFLGDSPGNGRPGDALPREGRPGETRNGIRPRPAELPRAIDDFVGRADNLAAVLSRLRRGGVATIAGKPGVGKSTLALHAAHRISADYPSGNLYVDLRGASAEPKSAAEALAALLGALGEEVEAGATGRVSSGPTGPWSPGGNCCWSSTTHQTSNRSNPCCPARATAR